MTSCDNAASAYSALALKRKKPRRTDMARFSYMASVAARRAIGVLTSLWPSGMLESRREAPQATRIVSRVAVTVAGRKLMIPAANIYHLQRFRDMAAGRKEANTKAWIEQTLRDGDVFLDVGANVGVFSALAGVVAPNAKVFAFEPELHSAAALAEMASINKLPITVFATALGARTRADVFHVNGKLAAGYSDHQLQTPIAHDGKPFVPAATIGAMIAAIDDLVAWGVVPPPTHIKIDVDGNDEAVIDGARSSLKSCRWIGVECTRSAAGDMLAKLAALGFEPSAEFSTFRGELCIEGDSARSRIPNMIKYSEGDMIFAERR